MTPLLRSSLPDQAAALLRAGIIDGRWARELPSESQLCRELGISRVTLRKAIAQLAREKWISLGGSGKRHRIRKSVTRRSVAPGSIVRVLVPYSVGSLGAVNHGILDHLSERLGAEGYRLEMVHRPALYTSHSPEELQRLNDLPDSAAWVLFYSTEEMQRWFERSGRPCVVMGFTYPEVKLPSIVSDVPAATRHAAGLFYQRGHRAMAYLIEAVTSRADRLGADAFVEAAHELGATAQVLTYGMGILALKRTIMSALELEPHPTAFFTSAPEAALTLLGTLIAAGRPVPESAAVIAGWSDSFLAYAVPPISHYRADGALLGRRLAECVLDVLHHGPGKMRTVQVVPEFVPQSTHE